MKLTKLLPLVGVAAIATPMVTSCTSMPTIKLDYWDQATSETIKIEYLRNTKLANMRANQKYCFNINMKNWKNYNSSTFGFWAFEILLCDLDDSRVFTSELLNYQVWIDNKELKYVDKQDASLEAGWFSYGRYGKHHTLFGVKANIKANSKMKISVEVPQDIYARYMMLGMTII